MNKENKILMGVVVVAVVLFGVIFAYQTFATKIQPVVQTQQNQTTQPSITVTLPNGGETYNNTVPVRWTSQNIQGDVNIQVFFASRLLFTVSSVPNTGSKDINLSDYYTQNSSANVVYIKICDTNKVCDISDQPFAFTFVAPTNQTAGWKTYTNTKYGYSVKYPTLGSTFVPTGNSNNIGIGWQNNSGPDEGAVYINVQQPVVAVDSCSRDFKNGTQVTINGVKFSKGDVSSSRAALISDTYATLPASTEIYADEYCAVYNGFVYRLTSMMDLSTYDVGINSSYSVPSRSDFENNVIVNAAVNSFKFTN